MDVVTQRKPEFGVAGEAGVVHRLDEARLESISPSVRSAVAGMHLEHRRVAAQGLRVPGSAAEDLGPVGGEVLVVLRAKAAGERMVELGVVDAAPGRGGREGKKGGVSTREFEEGRSRHPSIVPRDLVLPPSPRSKA